MNAAGQSPEYCWIKPTTTESHRAPGARRGAIPVTVRRRSTYRKASHKGTSPKGQSSGVALIKKPSSRSSFIPWRTAARAGRQRGLPPGVTFIDKSFQGAATVKVTVESNSEEEEDSEDDEEVVLEVGRTSSSFGLTDRVTGRQLDRMQMELKECRLRLAEERRARLKAESRLMEYELENARLRDANSSLSEALAATGSRSALRNFSALEDEAVLESIENSFNKFHAFLDLLKDAGLGQLASVAGINTSDFQPLGKPQLSSTMGPQSERAAAVTVEEIGDVQDDASLPSKLVTSPPGGTTFAPSHLSSSLHKDRLVDVTFNHIELEPADPAVAGEEEPHQYFRPDMQPDSGSEHSFHSQKSFDHFSFGNTFQARPRMETSSNRSNSNHRDGFSNNSAYSRASQNRGTHGGSSESVSEIRSDKAESVGSVGSRRSGKGRQMGGQPGSEWSEGRAYPGRASLKQTGSLRAHSDDESF